MFRFLPTGTDRNRPDRSRWANIDVWCRIRTRYYNALTFDPALDTTPAWSPDGKQLVFSSNRSLNSVSIWKNADGSGSEQEIAEAGADAFNSLDWSPDGKYILTRRHNELWYITMPEHTQKP